MFKFKRSVAYGVLAAVFLNASGAVFAKREPQNQDYVVVSLLINNIHDLENEEEILKLISVISALRGCTKAEHRLVKNILEEQTALNERVQTLWTNDGISKEDAEILRKTEIEKYTKHKHKLIKAIEHLGLFKEIQAKNENDTFIDPFYYLIVSIYERPDATSLAYLQKIKEILKERKELRLWLVDQITQIVKQMDVFLKNTKIDYEMDDECKEKIRAVCLEIENLQSPPAAP